MQHRQPHKQTDGKIKPFKCGAYLYDVVYISNLRRLDQDVDGEFAPNEGEIRIANELSAGSELVALLHEIDHAINHAFGLEDEEEEVNRRSLAQATVMIDNIKTYEKLIRLAKKVSKRSVSD